MSWIRDQIDAAILKIKGFFDGIKEMKDNVIGWFTEIKDSITEKIEAARDKIDGAIQKIKGFFNFDFTWPKLNMPRFGIDPEGWKIGDLLKGKIPKLSLKWNAEGGIFDSPTIFNTSRGLQGCWRSRTRKQSCHCFKTCRPCLDWNSATRPCFGK